MSLGTQATRAALGLRKKVEYPPASWGNMVVAPKKRGTHVLPVICPHMGRKSSTGPRALVSTETFSVWHVSQSVFPSSSLAISLFVLPTYSIHFSYPFSYCLCPTPTSTLAQLCLQKQSQVNCSFYTRL